MYPPAAEMDAAAAERVEVLRVEVAEKRALAPRTHGKGHRAHKSKDAGAKDKLKQLRKQEKEEREGHGHEPKHHHDHDGDDDDSEEAR